MSDLLVAGATSFFGSNITNYAIQTTKLSVATIDQLKAQKHIMNLTPSIEAKSRHLFYLAKVHDEDIINRLLKIEEPKHIVYNCIGVNYASDIEEQVANFRRFLNCVRRMEKAPETFVVLLKDFYICPDGHVRLEEIVRRMLSSAQLKRWYVVNTCDVFGSRQESSCFIPRKIVAMLEGRADSKDEASLREVMYIRDFFLSLMRLITPDEEEEVFSSGVYRVFSGLTVSGLDLRLFMSRLVEGTSEYVWDMLKPALKPNGVDLCNSVRSNIADALEHTVAWYDQNRWSWSK